MSRGFIDIVSVETDIDEFLTWRNNTKDYNRSLTASLEKANKITLTMNLYKANLVPMN